MFGVGKAVIAGAGGERAGPGYDPDAQAHFDRMASTDETLKGHINDLVVGLKADGIWSKIIVLNVVHPTDADTRLNIAGTSAGADSVKVGSPNFVANRGYKMTTNNIVYMNETAAGNSLDDDFHYWLYNRVDAADGAFTELCTTQYAGSNPFVLTVERSVGFSTTITTEGLSNGGKTLTEGNVPLTGFIGYSALRTSSILLHNTAYEDTGGGWGSAVNDNTTPFAVGGYKSGASTWTVGTDVANRCQYSGFGMGNYLTLTQLQNFRTRIQTYMTARGANV